MKNIFRFLMAVAVLFTASCAKEDISSSIGGGEVEVTFTANLPELGTRAYGEGEHITTLHYFVYDQNGTLLDFDGDGNSTTTIKANQPAKVNLPLIKGMTYKLAFWADNGSYNIANNVVSVNYGAANNDSLDAFYALIEEFDPAKAEDQHKTSVTLYRPFAQLNALTDDFAAVALSGVNIETSTVKVVAYTQFNVANGDVVEGAFEEIEFDATEIPTETLEGKEDYKYLSMNYILVPKAGHVSNVEFTFTGSKNVTIKDTKYDNVPFKQNYRTNILGKLLTASTDFKVEIKPGFGGEERYDVEDIHVATAQELAVAVNTVAATGGEVVLVEDIELSETISIIDQVASTTSRTAAANEKVIVIDGKGKTLTYTGSGASARAIDVTAKNVNLTIKNLTIDCTSSYCQRGINYNTTGTLTLENVTVKGKNVTYALNLPGSSDNANVTINNSSLTGNIALNVWGENAVVTATDSHFTSVDKSTAEGYSAIALNNDGATSAEGTVVTIDGGTVTALDENGELASAVRNGTKSGIVNISESTVVTGNLTSPVAIINYGTDQFYSCDTLQRAINKAIETNAASVVLVKDIVLTETVTVAEGGTVVLDLNGKTLSAKEEANAYVLNNLGTLTIKGNGVVNARGIYNGYGNGGDNVATAKLIVENGTFNAKGSNGGAAVYNYGIAEINGGNFTSIGSYSLNNQTGATMTIADGVTANNGIYCSGASLTINGGKVEGNRSGCHVVYAWNAMVTINGGAIYNNNSGNSTLMAAGTSNMTVNGGTLGIKDGRVPGNGNTWTSCLTDTQNSATMTVNGGTFNGGFRVQTGTSMEIKGGSFNDCYGSGYNIYGTVVVKGGTYTDANAYNFAKNHLAEGYTAVDNKNGTWTVKNGITTAAGLIAAVNDVEDGGTITLGASFSFTDEVDGRTNNNGYWDGISYSGDKSFTIDLNTYTIGNDNNALNDYLFWFQNNGEKANTITIKNGTLDAGTTAYCALCTASSNKQTLTVNVENVHLINNNSNGSTVKARGGSIVNIKSDTKITGKNSYLGVENWNATVNIYDGAEIYMNGTSSYNGCLVGVGGKGVINVYGGYGKGVSGGLIAMTSGGTINVSGGEWIANTDGTGANSNKSVLIAQSDKQYNAGATNSVVNVTGGTFKGGFNCYGNAVGDAQINITGGNFNNNPTSYIVDGKTATEANGIWTVQ